MPRKQDRDGVYVRKGRPGFWISYNDANGERRQEKTAATTAADAKVIRGAKVANVEKMKVLGLVAAAIITFESFTERYLVHQKPRITPQSYERTESIINNHLIPFFKKNLGDIRASDIERYVTKRMSVASAGTTIKELNVLKHLFGLAVRWELLPTDPSANVGRPPTPPDRVRYLGPDELLTVLSCCPEWLKPIVTLAISTGMRRGEILNLRWHDIDLRNRVILLGKTKNRKPRIVNLNKIAMAVLQLIHSKLTAPAIGKLFPDTRADYVTQAFKRATIQAKIEDCHFHDLRHTYASWVKMSGEDVQTVAALLGHKDLRMTLRYTHLSQSYLQGATAKIDNVFPALLNAYRDQDVTAEAVDKTEDA